MSRRVGMTIALVTALGLAAGCGKAKQSPCRVALQHALEVYEQSDATADEKAKARANIDNGVKACEADDPPAAVLECTRNAKTMDDLAVCQHMRRP